MQTFLPYASFLESAKVLDRQRLGKQRVETYQILRTLTGVSSGWQQHPAVKMWRGYDQALADYGATVCIEWLGRGYKDSLLPHFIDHMSGANSCEMPEWFGENGFHISHRSNLVRKLPDHYRQFFPEVPDDLPYIWPTAVQ
jgi:hypothetical protein